MARAREDAGQASVELVAAIPVLLVVTLVVGQLAVAGYALWSAGAAARAGARAGYVGGSAQAVARRSLPAPFRGGADVRDSGSRGVEVRVRAPSLVPGIPSVPVTARAGLGTGDGG